MANERLTHKIVFIIIFSIMLSSILVGCNNTLPLESENYSPEVEVSRSPENNEESIKTKEGAPLSQQSEEIEAMNVPATENAYSAEEGLDFYKFLAKIGDSIYEYNKQADSMATKECTVIGLSTEGTHVTASYNKDGDLVHLNVMYFGETGKRQDEIYFCDGLLYVVSKDYLYNVDLSIEDGGPSMPIFYEKFCIVFEAMESYIYVDNRVYKIYQKERKILVDDSVDFDKMMERIDMFKNQLIVAEGGL